MKTIVGVIVVLILLGGGWWLYSQNDTSTPEDEGQSMSDETSMPSELEEDEIQNNDPDSVSFSVSGTNFSFDVKEIRVKKGQTVTINFASEEGFHDWVVDEFGAATKQITAGQTYSITFTADQEGEFEYYCSVGNHREQGMVGTLIVE